MRRPRPGQAEVIWSGHQSAAKMVLPDAIDQHARGERVVCGDNPFSERKSPTRRFRIHWFAKRSGIRIERGNKSSLNGITLLFVISLKQNSCSRDVVARVA